MNYDNFEEAGLLILKLINEALMRLRSLFMALVFSICLQNLIFAQCSDAGVCSIGGHAEDAHTGSFNIGYTLGSSGKPDNVTFHSVTARGNFALGKGFAVDLSIPYNFQNGEFIKTSGIGDLMAVLSKQFEVNKEVALILSLGAVVPTGEVDLGGYAPQIFQSSQGSFDVLGGVGVTYGAFDASLGVQIPTTRSKNKFDELKRAPDLMLRGGYSVSLGKIDLKGEAILIKRLGLSSVYDRWWPLLSGGNLSTGSRYIDDPGSDQTQLNLGLSASTMITKQIRLNAYAAAPLLKRDNNTDGLKRAFTLSVGIGYLF